MEELDRQFEFEQVIGEIDGQEGLLLKARLKVTAPGRDPETIVLDIEARLSGPLASSIGDYGEFLLELLFERFREPLPRSD
jgi:hypothetical protein